MIPNQHEKGKIELRALGHRLNRVLHWTATR